MNPTLEIKVHRHNQEKAVFSEISQQVVGELRLDKADILESGMSGGKTSVTFFVVSETGDYYVIQTSAGILNMLTSAIKGAEGNWADNPVPNIWKG